jgi:hypothetical protein
MLSRHKATGIGERTRPRVHPTGAPAGWFLRPNLSERLFDRGLKVFTFPLSPFAFIRIHLRLN